MTKILSGKEVGADINSRLAPAIEEMKKEGITPTLAILKVGEDPAAASYEKGANNKAAALGIDVKTYHLPEKATMEQVVATIEEINLDQNIHGLLLFRPLPDHLDDDIIRNTLSPEKDIDGITDISMAGVFTGNKIGFPPCTAAAAMEILDYYGVNLEGAKVAVVGRSLVIGRPVAMMAMEANATVTICHTKTRNMAQICREADVLIVAAGKASVVGKEFFHKDQYVIDVGINMSPWGTLCGDVSFEEAEAIVEGITPVPGGVGSVTTTILMSHLVHAAWNQRSNKG